VSDRPTVSICIPMYNAERYAKATIASVLAQTFQDFEIVVVDNASTDDSVAAVAMFQDPRVRLLRNATNLGPERNWNRAVTEARGTYVKLLCADDLLYPRCIELQVSALDAFPAASFVAAHRDVRGPNGRLLLKHRGPRHHGELTTEDGMRLTVRTGTNPFGEPAAVLMRASALRKAGPFDGTRPWNIDIEYWCRLLEHGTVVMLPDTVCAFRVTTTSWSRQLAREQSRQTRALFLDLQRRYPHAISSMDVLVGSMRAVVLAAARRSLYALLG
jgi:glycosyltransferase involved in cell wall biosynthesis